MATPIKKLSKKPTKLTKQVIPLVPEEIKVKTYNPPQEIKDEIAEIELVYQHLKGARPDEDWDDYKKQFKANVNLNDDGTANVNLPLERAVIESKMSEELAKKPDVVIRPKGYFDIPKVEPLKVIWEDVWIDANTDEELEKVVQQKNKYGTGAWFEGFITDKKVIEEPIEADENGVIKYKKKIISNPRLIGKMIPIKNVWFSSDMKKCIYREKITMTEFNSRYKDNIIYFDTEYVKEDEQINLDEPYKSDEESGYNAEKREHITIIHYWDEIRDKYRVLANETKVMIRRSPIPYIHKQIPISIIIDHLNEEDIYGTGECEILRSIKSEQNTFRNIIIDQSKLASTPPVLVGAGITFEGVEPEFSAGAIWNFTGDINQIQPFKIPSPDVSAFNYNQILNEDSVAFTGIDIRSLLSAPAETATKTALKNETKLKRVKLTLRHFHYFLKRIGNQRLQNIMQFYPMSVVKEAMETGEKEIGNREVVVEGKKPVPVETPDGKSIGLTFLEAEGFSVFEAKPEYIRGNLDLDIVTDSTLPISRELEKSKEQEYLNGLAMIANIAPIAPQLGLSIEGLVKHHNKIFEVNDERVGINQQEKAIMQQNQQPQQDIGQMVNDIINDLPMPTEPAVENRKNEVSFARQQ